MVLFVRTVSECCCVLYLSLVTVTGYEIINVIRSPVPRSRGNGVGNSLGLTIRARTLGMSYR